MFAAAASEFPNDNPCLHRGVCWVLTRSDGPLVAERCKVEASPELEVELAEARDPVANALGEAEATPAQEAVATEPVAAEVNEETPPPPSETRRAVAEDGFLRFVAALVEIAECEGAAAQAETLPALLTLEPVPVDALGPAALRALLGAGLCVESDGAVRASERLASLVQAWSGVLRRTGDFSACGSVTLNEWAADLLAALLGDVQRASAMQYQLRRRGVAAFGMVQLAA
ncbi:MAG: hypothetical protein WKG00_00305 [Polyangiaceae bacterium]